MNVKNLLETCRACLQDYDNGVSLFEINNDHSVKLCDMLSSCVGIDVSADDGYPDKICEPCFHQLPAVWKFVEMCKSTDVILKKFFDEQKSFKRERISEPVEVKLEIKEEFDPIEAKSDHSRSDTEEETAHESDNPARSVARTRGGGGRREKRAKKGREERPEGALECPHCSHAAESECRLKKHLKRAHPEAWSQLTYPCPQCGKSFKRKSDRKVHARSHSGERPFACAHCPKRFSQSGTLILHTRRHTGETPFRCPDCPRRFACQSSMRRHLRSHSGERPYTCELCGAAFSQPATLRQHARVHSQLRPYACPVCGRALKTRLALRNHSLTHGERGFVCERCGKRFHVKANLDKHRKKMHRSEAGVCAVCGKPSSHLQRHMRTHATGAGFSCSLCPRSFRTEAGLGFHVTTGHSDRAKFRCEADGCSETFSKRNMLLFHTRKVHSHETPYVCSFCPSGFFRKSDMSRHINTIHPNEVVS